MPETIHGSISITIDAFNEFLIKLTLAVSGHHFPSNLLKTRLRVWFGLEPVGKHQAISEILEPTLSFQVMGNHAFPRTDSSSNSDNQSIILPLLRELVGH